jgi:hypothetical protein
VAFYARMHPQAAAEKKLMQNACRPLQMRSKNRSPYSRFAFRTPSGRPLRCKWCARAAKILWIKKEKASQLLNWLAFLHLGFSAPSSFNPL